MLNRLAEMIVESDISFQQLESMIEYGESTGSVEELMNLVYSADSFYFMPDVANDYDLGYAEEYAVCLQKHLQRCVIISTMELWSRHSSGRGRHPY